MAQNISRVYVCMFNVHVCLSVIIQVFLGLRLRSLFGLIIITPRFLFGCSCATLGVSTQRCTELSCGQSPGESLSEDREGGIVGE